MVDWRQATEEEDESIVAMCLALYAEDPSEHTVPAAQVRQTLQTFRDEPLRGRSIVLNADGHCAGYAFLVSYWSNELGGEICAIDELYLQPAFRAKGYGTALVRSLLAEGGLWPGRPVALELESTPDNRRARSLYRRLGFVDNRNKTLRLILADPS